MMHRATAMIGMATAGAALLAACSSGTTGIAASPSSSAPPATSSSPSTPAAPSSPAAPSTSTPATLPDDAELARVAVGSPHPGLAAICHHSGYVVDSFVGIRRTSMSFGPVAVVPVTCRLGTAHTPHEIGVYVPRDESARRAYLVLLGNEPGGTDYLDTQRMRLAGVKLHLVLSGLAATDSTCCPSLWYSVDYTLTATGPTGGKRVPIPAPS